MRLQRHLLWILPLSILLGAVLSFLQGGDWLTGWLAFSFLFLLSFILFTLSVGWAGAGKALVWMVALAFGLRLAGGAATYLLLPTQGYDEPDDRAGFVFTDAHRRDAQAWELASSDLPILNAFSEKYAYDQYGGLLAFSALVYRYLSPDMHRPLLLVLISAAIAALGLPFLWKAGLQQWGSKVASAAGWVFALYPESILLGGSAMREPYLMTFSAFALWGFVGWHSLDQRGGWVWLGLGLAGMLLVSPAVALVTLVILGGWLYFAEERGRIPWWIVAAAVIVFAGGLLLLSSALDRTGAVTAVTPFGVVNNWLREAVKWDVYQLERGSGRVQLLFEHMPGWMRLPFVVTYGIFQPVLPAVFFEPTLPIWFVIVLLRSAGWYLLMPFLIFAGVTASGPAQGNAAERKLWLWLVLISWAWILLASLRGGGDQWDNPRYREILFLWQALVAGYAWYRWREGHSPWLLRIALMEIIFILVFAQWYASRYIHLLGRLPFGWMVAIILGAWTLIGVAGWLRDRRAGA